MNEELEKLNTEARDLEERIADNVTKLLEGRMKAIVPIEVTERQSFRYVARQSYIDNVFKMYYY